MLKNVLSWFSKIFPFFDRVNWDLVSHLKRYEIRIIYMELTDSIMSYVDSEYGLTIPPSPVCMCLPFFPSASKSISILWNCNLLWHCAWLLSGVAVSAFAVLVMWAVWCKELELDCYKRRRKQIQGEPTWRSTEASDMWIKPSWISQPRSANI